MRIPERTFSATCTFWNQFYFCNLSGCLTRRIKDFNWGSLLSQVQCQNKSLQPVDTLIRKLTYCEYLLSQMRFFFKSVNRKKRITNSIQLAYISIKSFLELSGHISSGVNLIIL